MALITKIYLDILLHQMNAHESSGSFARLALALLALVDHSRSKLRLIYIISTKMLTKNALEEGISKSAQMATFIIAI